MFGDISYQETEVVEIACHIQKIRKNIPCAISMKKEIRETEYGHVTHPAILQIQETEPVTFCGLRMPGRGVRKKSPFGGFMTALQA